MRACGSRTSLIFHDAFGGLAEIQQPVQNKRLKGLLFQRGQHGVRRLKGLSLDAVSAGDLLQQFENIAVIIQDRDTRGRQEVYLVDFV